LIHIAEVNDVIEYIFEGMSILASVGLVDKENKQYGVYVTSKYSFRCADIAQDYVSFTDVIAIYKKTYNAVEPDNKLKPIWCSNSTKPITDMRNLC
jgi:hypothetical protein